MYFTHDALEQATRATVARARARRLKAAGVAAVVDLGCGIGGDLVAFARAGLRVRGVERDPVRAAIARANLRALGLDGEVIEADLARRRSRCSDEVPFLDPARRDGHGRRVRPRVHDAAVGRRLALPHAAGGGEDAAGLPAQPAARGRRGAVGQRRRRPRRGVPVGSRPRDGTATRHRVALRCRDRRLRRPGRGRRGRRLAARAGRRRHPGRPRGRAGVAHGRAPRRRAPRLRHDRREEHRPARPLVPRRRGAALPREADACRARQPATSGR